MGPVSPSAPSGTNPPIIILPASSTTHSSQATTSNSSGTEKVCIERIELLDFFIVIRDAALSTYSLASNPLVPNKPGRWIAF